MDKNKKNYTKCEKHDACEVCGISRPNITGGVWGTATGWICSNCQEEKQLLKKQNAFKQLDGEEPDCQNTDEIICPHCGSVIDNADVYESQILECEICMGQCNVVVDYIVSYTTEVVGDRIRL